MAWKCLVNVVFVSKESARLYFLTFKECGILVIVINLPQSHGALSFHEINQIKAFLQFRHIGKFLCKYRKIPSYYKIFIPFLFYPLLSFTIDSKTKSSIVINAISCSGFLSLYSTVYALNLSVTILAAK